MLIFKKKVILVVKTDFNLKSIFFRRFSTKSRVGGQRLFDFKKPKIFPDFSTFVDEFVDKSR